MKMLKCPTCKGAGKQTIESTTISPGKPVEKTSVEITCIICNGARKISQKSQDALDRQAALWCKCTTSSDDVTFHNDDECRDCWKHHYHCGNCGKICQVG